ncbi:transcriptional regulator containing an amidase domain and an AraC-type DNA-binding HTH domain [Opitutaceae bacterium TAV1]|nr:transcriptional regulator containing an amidase domain and an AraC-type DNA-binding HTH domain [Opitutaceae bacterium TAV1]
MTPALFRSACHAIPLTRPPSILRMSGRRTHGRHGAERYRLDRFWCLNLFQGEGELSIDGDVFPFHHGYAGITWPDADLVYTFRKPTVKTWAHFIPETEPDGRAVDIPVMQDLGREFEPLRAELQRVSSLYRAQPERAVARLWDILWQLVPEQPSGREAGGNWRHPIVARAMDEIDMHLAETIEVEALAGELGVSQTHLNRLFKAAVETTVGDYIRGRRMETALHLLHHTTMSIKQIAWQVGIPDAQHFNKAVRRQFGQPPSALRTNPDEKPVR